MKKLDFAIQSLLLLATLVTLALGSDMYVFILIFQFLLGCWQVIGYIFPRAGGMRQSVSRIHYRSH